MKNKIALSNSAGAIYRPNSSIEVEIHGERKLGVVSADINRQGEIATEIDNGIKFVHESQVVQYPVIRILATFQPERWTDGAPMGTPPVRVCKPVDIDVTGQILAMGLSDIRSLNDDDDSTTDLVDAEALGHSGPHHVRVVDSIKATFGVASLADLMDAQLVAARAARHRNAAALPA